MHCIKRNLISCWKRWNVVVAAYSSSLWRLCLRVVFKMLVIAWGLIMHSCCGQMVRPSTGGLGHGGLMKGLSTDMMPQQIAIDSQ